MEAQYVANMFSKSWETTKLVKTSETLSRYITEANKDVKVKTVEIVENKSWEMVLSLEKIGDTVANERLNEAVREKLDEEVVKVVEKKS